MAYVNAILARHVAVLVPYGSFDEIEGEPCPGWSADTRGSTDGTLHLKNRKRWFPVEYYTLPFGDPGSTMEDTSLLFSGNQNAGENRNDANVNGHLANVEAPFQQIIIQKEVDLRSPLLMEKCLKGEMAGKFSFALWDSPANDFDDGLVLWRVDFENSRIMDIKYSTKPIVPEKYQTDNTSMRLNGLYLIPVETLTLTCYNGVIACNSAPNGQVKHVGTSFIRNNNAARNN